ncbi:hypothetical protein E2C01_033786 [Portunus trituberculatus]|uniref:Ig-like domain-containing protein n=1 Tax=Portunus trituberculatus TaxID=210409 RepID=A0A5B7EYT9_PORTR|nr:hypothetical protein [Portunus trituberculatus]
MVFPHARSLLLMSLMLLVMQLPAHVLSTVNRKRCPCASAKLDNDTVVLKENLTDTTTRARELNCCARRLLAAFDPLYHPNDSITIVWYFKGKEYKVEEQWSKQVSTFEIGFCGLETLESNNLKFRDEGVYSCAVTSSSGASVTKNFSLCLKNSSLRGTLENTESTPDTCHGDVMSQPLLPL